MRSYKVDYSINLVYSLDETLFGNAQTPQLLQWHMEQIVQLHQQLETSLIPAVHIQLRSATGLLRSLLSTQVRRNGCRLNLIDCPDESNAQVNQHFRQIQIHFSFHGVDSGLLEKLRQLFAQLVDRQEN